MHLPVLNIRVEQLLSKFKAVCSLAKSTQKLSVGISVTSYCICAAKLNIFATSFFVCVCVCVCIYHKSMDTALAFSLLM